MLYRGDPPTKYSKPNQPFLNAYKSVVAEEIAIVNTLPNEQEASTFMLHAVDLDEGARTVHPNVPTQTDLTNFVIPVDRHEAYEKMWNGLTYVGVLANTAMWLYL